MFEFNYSQLMQVDVRHRKVNRHGTHIFAIYLKAEGCEDSDFAGMIYLRKNQEIHIVVNSAGVYKHWEILGRIFKEKLTKILLEQITAEQLTKLIK